MNLDSGLCVCVITSVMHYVQIMPDLVYPMRLFLSSKSASYIESAESDKLMLFRLASIMSKHPTIAEYSSCASCCSKLIKSCLTWQI